jgi:copper(I)-binding protein
MSVYLASDPGHVTWRRAGDSAVVHVRIRNPTDATDHLIEVYSPDYDEVRLLRTVSGSRTSGQWRPETQNLAAVVIPRHSAVVLGTAEGYILASRPRRKLSIEDEVCFALRFASETTLIARLPFRRADDGMVES